MKSYYENFQPDLKKICIKKPFKEILGLIMPSEIINDSCHYKAENESYKFYKHKI